MKLNWGHKIALTFVAFFLLMGTLVFKSINTDFQLVSPDYYEQEIEYQQRIDAINRASNIGVNFIPSDNEYLTITIDRAIDDGFIYFYCPFDQTSDFKVKLNLKNGIQNINTKDLKKGKWEAEVVFKENDLLHIIKKVIVI